MSVLVHFSEDVALAVGNSPLNVTFASSGQPIQGNAVVSSYDSITHDATFTFDGYTEGILSNARYHAELPAGSVSDTNGVPTNANYSFDFAVLAGDGDQNGTVDIFDFNVLAANFGKSKQSFVQGNYDYSASGMVDILDFNVLAANFGKTTSISSGAPAQSALTSQTTTSHVPSLEPTFNSTLLSDANLTADGLVDGADAGLALISA
jgi:hypothetical protein